MEIHILEDEEIKNYFDNEKLPENKIIAAHGQSAAEVLKQLANSQEKVFVKGLNKEILLTSSLCREMHDGTASGPYTYQIVASDNGKSIGRCTFQVLEHGVHLSFIGIDEAAGDAYQGKGVGHTLLVKLEDYATKLHANFIDGIFCPMGKYSSATDGFYKNHGYEFFRDYDDHGRLNFYKKLKDQSSPDSDGSEKSL